MHKILIKVPCEDYGLQLSGMIKINANDKTKMDDTIKTFTNQRVLRTYFYFIF